MGVVNVLGIDRAVRRFGCEVPGRQIRALGGVRAPADSRQDCWCDNSPSVESVEPGFVDGGCEFHAKFLF